MILKVGVDVRILSRPFSGIGRYVLEMCKALSKISEVSLYLYSPALIKDNISSKLKAHRIREMDLDSGLLKQLWGEVYLPLWSSKDEIDVFWGPAHRLPFFLSRKIARVSTIHDLAWKFAGDTMRPFSRLLEKYQMPIAVRLADIVVADSESTATDLKEEFLVESSKVNVVPPGVSCAKKIGAYESLLELGIRQPYFLFVGTPEPRKNLPRLLQAYSNLDKSLKEQVMMVVVGDNGWGDVSISNVIAELNLAQYVRLLGRVDEVLLTTLYANAIFLAMPSVYEGFGLPLVESMIYGVPVLTSNNSSMPEVAGNAGLLVDAEDVVSIENGLKELISNEDLRLKLATKAKDNASRFDWDNSAKLLVRAFKKAISIRNSCSQ